MKKIQKGDKVMVIGGKNKGKVSTIVSFSKEKRRKNGTLLKAKWAWVILQNVNIAKKAVKGQGFKDVPQPIAVSNVMHYDEEKKVASKVTIVDVKGKKKRKLVKTGRIID